MKTCPNDGLVGEVPETLVLGLFNRRTSQCVNFSCKSVLKANFISGDFGVFFVVRKRVFFRSVEIHFLENLLVLSQN